MNHRLVEYRVDARLNSPINQQQVEFSQAAKAVLDHTEGQQGLLSMFTEVDSLVTFAVVR